MVWCCKGGPDRRRAGDHRQPGRDEGAGAGGDRWALFQLGDPQNLRRVLLDVIEDPSQLQAMRLKAPEVPTIEAQAGIVTQLYVQAITTRPPVA